MAKNLTPLIVVAAALQAADGRWLMHRRPEGKDHAGLWEFPGGKVEPGETPPAALRRELEEETGLLVNELELREIGFAVSEPDHVERQIVILLYTTQSWTGLLEAREGGTFAWHDHTGIDDLPKPPLDVALARQLFEKSG
ncbi:(deoxy)nucleoside triphosphate pyrophosphohydrolase [Parerythrobacter aestuarii]|uniref:(deoxy)nucleoside triphosphate pyrophosphohydrolase n=1 Tax=Parerythrobacter aestuarii TaxID=3020909 RepID=UPI0024DE73B6|nr:(deoxy)nucleoside triphosphate pyrophosphohydrolase [Parerythrobacter aestuarii]